MWETIHTCNVGDIVYFQTITGITPVGKIVEVIYGTGSMPFYSMALSPFGKNCDKLVKHKDIIALLPDSEVAWWMLTT